MFKELFSEEPESIAVSKENILASPGSLNICSYDRGDAP
jgi:hypothetical protein